ncbi:hypothetical protein A6A03_17895 [Chloroflexus islandicus]|uniref:Cas10/Cmr2 second palm domain-containing protein n=1 Tax=Chloroflexus islandicus TaxID=1707952 RepID=A0A178M4W0_9CHLR|nr:hypothetical protein [Chloroflexus islandicus]OAN43790.1 hypothetical protein A6A03_17895 [Chloroflexus islandicus]
MPYLLAAEADKIQDLIFRSSRLREVVGASQLLTRFCKSVGETLAKQHGGTVIVNDGGSFRVMFNDQKQAEAFGNDLAELYQLALGGSLTVAEPVEVDDSAEEDDSFKAANQAADQKLRWAKSRRSGVVAEAHMPYVAFCESCGVALAERRDTRKGRRSAGRRYYLCQTCQVKQAERDRAQQAILDDLYKAYREAAQIQGDITPDWPEDADDIADFDLSQRNYVAYLVADGNGMGQIFGSCNQQQMTDLSQQLTTIIQNSLAQAIARFRQVVPGQAAMIPVLPLILGGDDLFALIPAPYALDVARQFCLAWERGMANFMQKMPENEENDLKDLPRPTIAAAVVICKSKYPYSLAYQRAKDLLKQAKQQSKRLAAATGEHLSAVNFEVILGNRLAAAEDSDDNTVIRRTLRPYWVGESALSRDALEYGIALNTLLQQRYVLKDLPNKRLAELRRCFENVPANVRMDQRKAALEKWAVSELARILLRLSQQAQQKVTEALIALGSDKVHYWRDVKWGNKTPLAHGMLDLLEVWDFAQDLTYTPDAYEPQEDEA